MKPSVFISCFMTLIFYCTVSVSPVLSGSDSSDTIQGDPDDIYWDDRFDELGVNGTVLSLLYSGTDLIVSGDFDSVGQISANNIATWDGSAWSVIGSPTNGTNGAVNALALDGSNIIVGGTFTSAGGTAVNNIAKWDGSSWSALGTGLVNADIQAIAVSNGNVYVGGIFTSAGGQQANNIAVWDGESWSAIIDGTANGVNAPVFALAAKGDSIFVGGSFTAAGEQSASNIAIWNTATQSWSALGNGVNLDVLALTLIENDLFAAGIFSTAGGNTARKIARWDGSQWHPLGEGITSGSVVEALTVVGNDLFVGGSFTTVGNSVTANNIALWDGSAWSKLGSGISGGPVFALEANTLELYAGGSFSSAGEKPSDSFARWTQNGSVPVELSLFSAQLDGELVELTWTTTTEENNYGFEIERRVKSHWEVLGFVPGAGTSTVPLSYRFEDDVKSLLATDVTEIQYRLKQIDVDGTYTYYDAIKVQVGAVPEKISLSQNYPNPFNPATTIEFFLPETGFTTLTVYDILGREVDTIVHSRLESGSHQVIFDATALPSGVYYYLLRQEGSDFAERRRMVLVK